MFYTTDLEEFIFSKHEQNEVLPDELIVISGYLGPGPIERLSELPFKKFTVIGGMYNTSIDARLLHSINKLESSNPSLNVLYATQEVHSKIYIWKKDSKILYALIGSANFSRNGLQTNYRESLADVTRDSFAAIENYYQSILNNSVETPPINSKQKVITLTPSTDMNEVHELLYSYEIPLYSFTKKKGKYIPESSGLNWGRARLTSKAHTSQGDIYIRLPKDIIANSKLPIKPVDTDFEYEGKKRLSEPIELIWDDGTNMQASFEGTQDYKNETYPKQLASYSKEQPILEGKKIAVKSILGRYIRNRLGVGVDEIITMDTLRKYGRDTLTLSYIEPGVYYADFSV